MNLYKNEIGFTLVEILFVISILSIIAVLAYPSYNRYVVATHRTDMMTRMMDVSNNIEADKLARGSYEAVDTSIYSGEYLYSSGTALYTITIDPQPLTSDWIITAKPEITGKMKDDGTLTLDSTGLKCRDTICGRGKEWKTE